jgi:hypothetical protein
MSPHMPNKQPPFSLTGSPTAEQLQRAEDEGNGHVTRAEFRALRADVHEIKEALIGPMTKGGILEEHRQLKRTVDRVGKLAWLGTIGAMGFMGKTLWDTMISGKHP